MKGESRGEMSIEAAVPANGKNMALAYALLRATLGLNIFFHGVSRIVQGPAVFASTLVPMFLRTPLPVGFVYDFGLVLPWVEATLGFLLLIGLRARFALIAGALLILILTFGTSLRQDWATAALQLTYAAVYAALLAFHDRDVFSVDGLMARK
jgi:thiosulfate dehydrogenase (quinone) large subunit